MQSISEFLLEYLHVFSQLHNNVLMSNVLMGMMLMIHHIMHAVCAVDYIPSPQSKFLYDVNVNIMSKSGTNNIS